MFWKTPAWIQDAKFGLRVDWGRQSVPRLGGGWYARRMYMRDTGLKKWGRNAYRKHCEAYGHPSHCLIEMLTDVVSKDGRALHAFIYGPKAGTEVVVKSFSLVDGLVHGQPLSVSLIGGDRLTATMTPEGLRVRLLETLPSRYACALKIGHN